MSILYILLFLVCLSTLVMVHEFGHLITAKIFKVYCFEYSIGFGPKLISKKRKNGETYFSLRAIPFGGFVSMFGEDETLPEGMNIDPKRSLLSIKKWKKAIIMSAGIIMNFILAILIFFVYEVGFPKYQSHYAHISVDGGSLAYDAGLRNDDFIYALNGIYDNSNYIFYDDSAVINYATEPSEEVFLGFNFGELTIKDTRYYAHAYAFAKGNYGDITPYTSLEVKTIEQINNGDYVDGQDYLITGYITSYSLNDYLVYVTDKYANTDCGLVFQSTVSESKKETVDDAFASMAIGEVITFAGKVSEHKASVSGKEVPVISIADDAFSFSGVNFKSGNVLTNQKGLEKPSSISFKITKIDGETFSDVNFTDLEVKDGILPSNLGINMQLETRRETFGSALKNTFRDFGEAATLIGRSLGMLLTDASSWKDVGGIIAIGVVTTQTLQNFGFGQFLFYWALISVNLGIVNLLPFPGLDGWHLLVTVIEGVTRKELPKKFKNYASLVGLVLLFGLMILIVIKDIIQFI